jgi:hypothetical protein
MLEVLKDYKGFSETSIASMETTRLIHKSSSVDLERSKSMSPRMKLRN